MLAFLLACAPGPRVVSAEEIGVVGQSGAIDGRDGGGSALVFGRMAFTYGDTVLTVADEWGRNWHHNSVSMTYDADASDGIADLYEPLDDAGAPRHLVPPTEEEYTFNEAHWDDGDCEEPCGARWATWPGEPVWDDANERALVFYGLIYAEPGGFNFEGRGTSIAVWEDPEGVAERPVVDAGAEHPDLVWGAGEPGWGIAPVILDGMLHAWACEAEGLGRPCKLARAPLADIHDHDAWRYWDGAAWNPDAAAAVGLFEGAPILSMSFVAHLDAWLAVYAPPFDGSAYARTAPALTGPWSEAAVVYTVPEGEDAPYDVVHHAAYEEEGGRVQYLTYSRHTEGWFGTEFPLVRVEFE